MSKQLNLVRDFWNRFNNEINAFCSGNLFKEIKRVLTELNKYYNSPSENVCSYCERELINEDMRTENGCIWCSPDTHNKSYKITKENLFQVYFREHKKLKEIAEQFNCGKRIRREK